MGTVVHVVSVVCLNDTALPSCSWLPGFPPPWYWLPLKTVTHTGSVGKTGSRMPALPNGSGLPGKCHALPSAIWNPFPDAYYVTPRTNQTVRRFQHLTTGRCDCQQL